jgi:ketosteroid isomerase-like protein
MTHIRTWAGAVVLAAAVAAPAAQPPSPAPASSDADEIARLETAWNEAHRRGDAEVLELLWGDDLVVTVPGMAKMTRADLLPIFRSGRMKFQRFETSDVETRLYGDSAVVTGRLERTREVDGRSYEDDWRFTKVYARRPGGWQVVVFHGSPTVLERRGGSASPAADEEQIRQAIADFVEAYNAGDAERVVSFYAKDLVKLPAGGPAEKRAETARRVADVMRRYRGHLEVHNDEVSVAGSMAFTRGRLAITLAPRAGGRSGTVQRRYLEIWRKENDRWRVARTMDNSSEADPPLKAPGSGAPRPR